MHVIQKIKMYTYITTIKLMYVYTYIHIVYIYIHIILGYYNYFIITIFMRLSMHCKNIRVSIKKNEI